VCYVNLAYKLKDADICNKADYVLQMQAPFFVDNDLEKTDWNAANGDTIVCQVEVAKRTKNIGICLQLNPTAGAEVECVTEVAKHTLDSAICDGIKREYDRKLCQVETESMSVANKMDEQLCNGLPDSLHNEEWNMTMDMTEMKHKCILEVARLKKDISLCNMTAYHFDCDYWFIHELLYRGNCSEFIMGDTGEYFNCALAMMILKDNATACNGTYEWCVQLLNRVYYNDEFCETVKQKDRCYGDLAQSTNNKSWCNHIGSPDEKQNCLDPKDKYGMHIINCFVDSRRQFDFYTPCSITGKSLNITIKNDPWSEIYNVTMRVTDNCIPTFKELKKSASATFKCSFPEKHSQYVGLLITFTDKKGIKRQHRGYVNTIFE
jgi:hypothetical protein